MTGQEKTPNERLIEALERAGELAALAPREPQEVLRDADWPGRSPRVRASRVRKRLYFLLFVFLTLAFSIGSIQPVTWLEGRFALFERWSEGDEESPFSFLDWGIIIPLGISDEGVPGPDGVLEPARHSGLMIHYRIFLNMLISAIISWALYMRARERAASLVIDGQNKQLRDLNAELSRKVDQVQRYAKKLEETQSSLVHAQKLASIGRMSATLAHEIRNPMSIIMSAAGIAADDLPPGSPPAQALNLIRQEITRLDQIITELLNFARPKPPRLDTHDLNSLVYGWLHPLEEELAKHHAQLHVDLSQDVPLVSIDADQLYQVLLNVVWNARDAVKENGGGLIVIHTEAGHDGTALLVVKDDGPGIDKETMQQIFEPFYTTKTSGSGLGLPVVEQLMEGMGGSVEITTELERGTTVCLRLRAAQITGEQPQLD